MVEEIVSTAEDNRENASETEPLRLQYSKGVCIDK
jgi:hypothetical protein